VCLASQGGGGDGSSSNAVVAHQQQQQQQQQQQPSHTLVSARVTEAGSPVIVLSNGCAYTYHVGMKSLVRVADDSFTASSLFSRAKPAEGQAQGVLARAVADSNFARLFRSGRP
jgi:hypothetical protein